LGVSIQTGASSNLYAIGSTDHEASLDLSLAPTYQFAPDWSVGALLAASQGLTDLQETTLDRTDLVISWKGRRLNSRLTLAASGGIILPYASKRLVLESLLVGARAGVKVSFRAAQSPLDFLTLSYTPSVAKFFHEYRTSVDGTPNSEFSISQTLGLEADVGAGLSLSSAFVLLNGWTYGGTQSDRFRVDGELGYALSERSSLSLGVSTSGTQLKANGVDPNLAIFDTTRSQIWASFGVSL
jgi:hypothetical protein